MASRTFYHDVTTIMKTRRRLLQLAAGASLSSLLPSSAVAQKKRPDICIYSEHFQSLPIAQVCKVFKKIGAEGIDLTVRPGGHIQPANAKKELPIAVKTATDHGLKIMMLTTSITGTDLHSRQIVEACDKLGIQRIKLGYHHIGKFGQLAKRLDEVRRQLDALVKMTSKYKVRPCVHVHSGATIPSNGFMLREIIKHIPPDRIGAYLDSYHMTITGGAGGWKQAIDLLRPWISLVALKNFEWRKGGRDKLGQQRWSADYVRLEDGIANIPDFVRTVQRIGYKGFYTLHTEYRRPLKDCIKMTGDDFVFLKKIFS